ncbi:dTDP-glucose 4,6-dehydratase [Actinomadura chibensis]|uniref:dTDP-glucose 4,6-dehydratase n=1 Tax=Actinomadura chibensis TaxID=392828 RepID=A0A5D0NUX1_9ACTN|nr:dTDP-glucose 4,6-dehydratase [Actinomadura chibensis]TYB47988.1 dTDP-glucose 4,6-dehydratase [Actinomadura chibensis]
MRVLVCGGAGFIGSHYVRTMLGGGYPGFEDARVTVLDKLTYAGDTRNLPLEHANLTFVRGDLCDADLLAGLVPGHDLVVNFAAESHVDRSLGPDAGLFSGSNVVGVQLLLEQCLRAGPVTVVQVSTDEVYGSIERGAWTEREPLLPNSPYAASKAGGELMARAYHRTHGLDVRVTRCSNNYGPHQHVEKLIPRFITNLLSGRQVPLYGDGRNVREWLHVDDHCRAVHLVATRASAGTVYNVGGGTALSNLEMTGRLLDLCGADWSAVRRVEDRKGHDLRYAVDDSAIRADLGYRPRWTLDEGLPATVDWYKSNPWFWEPHLSTAA